jgi:tyrosinase
MSKISRRSFVAGTAAAGLGAASLLEKSAQAQVQPPPIPPIQPGPIQPIPPIQILRVRHNVLSAQGQTNLQKYRQAVQIMMGTPSTSPLSWVFQWYTHWTRSDSTKAAQLSAIFGPGASPQKTLATQMWNTCQAHHQMLGGPDEWFFCPWHRMYVYYFERICRKVLNDNAFTLPYWNYSSPTASNRAIPPAFRVPGSSLFRTARNAGINAGNPIGTAAQLSPNPALSRTAYVGAAGFNQTLDGGLHGQVHVRVGNNTQGMGTVPWAANDPVFWMHHCNIDRLWASWNRAGRLNPTAAAWLNKTFTFADENGMPVTAKISDFDSTAERGYTYDHFEPVPAAAGAALVAGAAAAAAPGEASPVTLASTSSGVAAAAAAAGGGIPLEPTGTRVSLTPAPAAGAAAAALTDRIAAAPPERQIHLVIRGYRAEAQPGVTYDVYLDLPATGAAGAGEGHYVGTLNFFGVVPHDGHEGHGATASPAAISFDVTELAKRLKAEGELSDTPTVTIVPAGEPATDAKPVVGEIALVEQ